MEKATKIKLSDGTIVDISGREYTLESFGITVTPGEINYLSGLDENIITKLEKQLNESKSYTNEEIKKITDDITKDVICSHKYEITGNTGDEHGLAIDDQQMVLTKIQGQTRRKSLNEVYFEDVPETTKNGITCSVKNGVITLNGTCNYDQIDFLVSKLLSPKPKYKFRCFSDLEQGSSTWQIWIGGNQPQYVLGTSNSVAPINQSETFRINLAIYKGYTFNNAKLYPMLVDGDYNDDTFPLFEPYDNTLVNSKCNLISTGRNLFDINEPYLQKDNGVTINKTGFTFITTNNTTIGNCQIQFFSSKTNFALENYISGIDINKTGFVPLETKSARIKRNGNNEDCVIYYDFEKLAGQRIFFGGNITTNEINKQVVENIMINYGSTSLPFEPYKEDKFIYNVELGQFDYHDNVANNTYKQTSSIWKWNKSMSFLSGGKYTYGYRVQVVELPNTEQGETQGVSNWEYSFSSISGPDNANQNSICIFNKNIYIFVSGATSESEVRTKLNENPPQLAYKLVTPTITSVTLPAGYAVYNGGLQIQETDTLPYVLTKKYSLSMKAQILANIEIDREQQNQIDELYIDIQENKNEIDNIKNVTYQKILDCDHEYEITGKTGHEYNLAVPDETTLKLLTIKGQTGRSSEQLIKPEYLEKIFDQNCTTTRDGYVITMTPTKADPYVYCSEFSLPAGNYSYIYKTDKGDEVSVIYINGNPITPFIKPSKVVNFTLEVESKISLRFDGVEEGTAGVQKFYGMMLVKGTYNDETMPSFEEFDNTLVNAKCNLISTNKNLFDISAFTHKSDTASILSNEIKFETTKNTTQGICWLTLFDSNGGIIQDFIDKENTFHVPNHAKSFRFKRNGDKEDSAVFYSLEAWRNKDITYDFNYVTQTNNLVVVNNIIFSYGSSVQPYEPHEKDTFILNEELGEFDYIDNMGHKKVKGQSPIIVASNLTFSPNPTSLTTVDIYNANLPSKCVSYTSVDNGVLPNIANFNEDSIHYYVESSGSSSILSVFIPKGQEVKTYLQSINFQFAYKLATPTITELNLPAGYKAWNGGLQWQQPQGKYLPYVLTKEYAISQKAQIDLNADMNVNQQALIDKNKSDIEQLKNSIGTSISYEEIFE